MRTCVEWRKTVKIYRYCMWPNKKVPADSEVLQLKGSSPFFSSLLFFLRLTWFLYLEGWIVEHKDQIYQCHQHLSNPDNIQLYIVFINPPPCLGMQCSISVQHCMSVGIRATGWAVCNCTTITIFFCSVQPTCSDIIICSSFSALIIIEINLTKTPQAIKTRNVSCTHFVLHR